MKRQKVIIFFIVFATLVFTTRTGRADTSPTVKYLMNESVTLMDLGMLKFGLYLREILKHSVIENVPPDAFPKYDQDANKIFVKVIYFDRTEPKKSYSSQNLVPQLKEVLSVVRKELGVSKKGKPYLTESVLKSMFFSHCCSLHENELQGLGKSLDEMTQIDVSFFNAGTFLKCSGPLVGVDITCRESRKP